MSYLSSKYIFVGPPLKHEDSYAPLIKSIQRFILNEEAIAPLTAANSGSLSLSI